MNNNIFFNIEKNIISINEVARLAGVTKKFILDKVKDKELIPVKKASCGMLFDRREVEEKLKIKKVTYSRIVTLDQLGNLLTNESSMLVCGAPGSDKTFLIKNIISKQKALLLAFNKKINVNDPYNDLDKSIVNNFTEINDDFFIHDMDTAGAIASILAENEINAIEEISFETNKSIDYILSKFDYVVVISGYNTYWLIETKNIRKILSNSNLFIYGLYEENSSLRSRNSLYFYE